MRLVEVRALLWPAVAELLVDLEDTFHVLVALSHCALTEALSDSDIRRFGILIVQLLESDSDG